MRAVVNYLAVIGLALSACSSRSSDSEIGSGTSTTAQTTTVTPATVALSEPIIRASIRSTLTGHTDDVNSVAFSPDSTKIVTGSNDNTGKIWDVTAG